MHAHVWANRRYAFDASVAHSIVQCSVGAIDLLQRANARYFQRPDHKDHRRYDATRARLDGWSTDLSLARTSGEHWLGSLAWTSASPGYEANALGSMSRTYYRGISELVMCMANTPGRLLRDYTIKPYANPIHDFGGDISFNYHTLYAGGTLHNYWSFDVSGTYRMRYVFSTLDQRVASLVTRVD